jgi:hypothetical protein
MGADNALFGGSIAEFADSMAQEIETAYNAVLAENGRLSLPKAEAVDRRMLFIAISRGVINHLQKKQKALTVTVPPNPSNTVVTTTVNKR